MQSILQSCIHTTRGSDFESCSSYLVSCELSASLPVLVFAFGVSCVWRRQLLRGNTFLSISLSISRCCLAMLPKISAPRSNSDSRPPPGTADNGRPLPEEDHATPHGGAPLDNDHDDYAEPLVAFRNTFLCCCLSSPSTTATTTRLSSDDAETSIVGGRLSYLPLVVPSRPATGWVSVPCSGGDEPSPRKHYACTLVGGDRVVVHGGITTAGGRLGDVWSVSLGHDDQSRRWTRLDASSSSCSLSHHAAAAIGDGVYLHGGRAGAEEGTVGSQLWGVHSRTGQIALLADVTVPLHSHRMVAVATRLFLAGGFTAEGNRPNYNVYLVELGDDSATTAGDSTVAVRVINDTGASPPPPRDAGGCVAWSNTFQLTDPHTLTLWRFAFGDSDATDKRTSTAPEHSENIQHSDTTDGPSQGPANSPMVVAALCIPLDEDIREISKVATRHLATPPTTSLPRIASQLAPPENSSMSALDEPPKDPVCIPVEWTVWPSVAVGRAPLRPSKIVVPPRLPDGGSLRFLVLPHGEEKEAASFVTLLEDGNGDLCLAFTPLESDPRPVRQAAAGRMDAIASPQLLLRDGGSPLPPSLSTTAENRTADPRTGCMAPSTASHRPPTVTTASPSRGTWSRVSTARQPSVVLMRSRPGTSATTVLLASAMVPPLEGFARTLQEERSRTSRTGRVASMLLATSMAARPKRDLSVATNSARRANQTPPRTEATTAAASLSAGRSTSPTTRRAWHDDADVRNIIVALGTALGAAAAPHGASAGSQGSARPRPPRTIRLLIPPPPPPPPLPPSPPKMAADEPLLPTLPAVATNTGRKSEDSTMTLAPVAEEGKGAQVALLAEAPLSPHAMVVLTDAIKRAPAIRNVSFPGRRFIASPAFAWLMRLLGSAQHVTRIDLDPDAVTTVQRAHLDAILSRNAEATQHAKAELREHRRAKKEALLVEQALSTQLTRAQERRLRFFERQLREAQGEEAAGRLMIEWLCLRGVTIIDEAAWERPVLQVTSLSSADAARRQAADRIDCGRCRDAVQEESQQAHAALVREEAKAVKDLAKETMDERHRIARMDHERMRRRAMERDNEAKMEKTARFELKKFEEEERLVVQKQCKAGHDEVRMKDAEREKQAMLVRQRQMQRDAERRLEEERARDLREAALREQRRQREQLERQEVGQREADLTQAEKRGMRLCGGL